MNDDSAGSTVRRMDGWQHTTRDFDPTIDGDQEAWARSVARDGWRTWHDRGLDRPERATVAAMGAAPSLLASVVCSRSREQLRWVQDRADTHYG